ncbi:FAD-dependent oxidoreductase [bacterium]|nr:FAD-dependent oxidoreductase [bacterium]
MKRISSLDDFKIFRSVVTDEVDTELPCLVICAGTGGQASGSNEIIRVVKRYILENDLQGMINLRITGCQGFCEMDPFILVEPGKNLYPRLKMDDVPGIIDAAIKGKIIPELLYHEPYRTQVYETEHDIPFFKKQTRTILGHNELLDPIRVYNYIKHQGYTAIEKVLQLNDPEWVIAEVKRAGLRGRGGAGFLTGRKWEFARAAGNGDGTKYMVCNADEGDPGAYMDRSLLEGNPHLILEGIIIAGLAIGASKGIIYVRSEYPLAIKHSKIALRQIRELGLLGENILGTGFSFDIEIVRGAGAFVCGEETALIKSIEGKIGEPRQRPPFPVERGIFGFPTCINNVETLANIPIIINKGAEEYAKVGIPGNTGTKIFSLVGKIRNTGLVEVPMGTKISTIINDIGGGPIGKAKIKAIQTGGPSGGCIPASMFHLSIDYDSLTKAGSIMGSGGMIVMDDNTCMVDVAKYFMKFLKEESCGKCYPCRKGTQRMYELLDDITQGRGTLEHLDLLEELAHIVKDTTMCGLGQTASNPVLSTLRYFRDEYITHIIDKKCPALVCRTLVGPPCHAACPIDTEAWRYVAHIANEEYEQAYITIREANPFPSVCARVCDHQCEMHCRLGRTGTNPVAIRSLKRFVTDRIEPSVYKPVYQDIPGNKGIKVAVVGSGPAGLTAAHYLSLKGYSVSVYEAASKPGGMLMAGVPSYRLPRDIITKEIESLLDHNITLQCNKTLGKDFTLDDLFNEGHKAAFLALGAHRSRKLELAHEDSEGVYPSMQFLRSFNLDQKVLARGRVGVIGGGNSAIDAARVALRQKEVESVTIFYRRGRAEMPGYTDEIEAGIEEGVTLKTLVSPVKLHVKQKRLVAVDFIENELGSLDDSGRARFIPKKGSEFTVELDTLIVAIGEQLMPFDLTGSEGLEFHAWGPIKVDQDTLQTHRAGVFAGGDIVTGPNSVVNAIAAGKKGAVMIDRFIHGQPLRQPAQVVLPDTYVEPRQLTTTELSEVSRAEPIKIPLAQRKVSFAEVEQAFSKETATAESMRCLRCDLEFVQKPDLEHVEEKVHAGGK